MRRIKNWLLPAALAGVAMIIAACATLTGGGNHMTFFVTSVGLGKGADLGGLAGADRHCQNLATAVGSTRTWRAYLSTQAKDGGQTVNARDRIGNGPWRNFRGDFIASDVNHLHGPSNNVTKQTALNEKGHIVAGRGDKPNNRHDILTGVSLQQA